MNDGESSSEESSELYRRHEHAIARAPGLALESVRAQALPKEISPPGELEGLGDKVVAEAYRKLERLHQEHGAQVPRILSLAMHELWFSAWHAAHYLRELHFDLPQDEIPDTSKETWAPEWHLQRDGWDGCLRNTLYDVEPGAERLALLSDLGIDKHPGAPSVQIAAAVVRFAEASERLMAGDIPSATNALHDAYMLLGDEYGMSMWDAAEEDLRQGGTPEADRSARSALAKLGAAARHAENRSMKQQVFAWCDQNMTAMPSMDAAASRVAGTLVPVAWRTVRDWMTEWKKLRSAGTA